MSKFHFKDRFMVGFLMGSVSITVLYFILTGIDHSFEHFLGRPLFTKPDAKQLIILTTLIFLFREQIKGEELEKGRGLFLALFISTMAYLFYKKTNFALW